MYEKKMNWKKNNVSIFPKIYTILLRSAFGIRHSKAFGRIFVSIVALKKKKKKKKKKKNFRRRRRRRRLLPSSFPGERVLSKTTRERERENLTNEHAKGKERRRRRRRDK